MRDLSGLPLAPKWAEWGLRRDEVGMLRTPEGDIWSPTATAYDTCFVLGQEPDYGCWPLLPPKVVDYFMAWEKCWKGTLEAAVLGWRRGRERSLRDHWKAPKEQSMAAWLRSQRSGKSATEAEAAPASSPTLPVEIVPTPSWVKRAADDGPTAYVERDPEKVVFSKSVIASLKPETRARLKACLSPRQYENAYGYQVFRNLRCQSRGLSSEESLLVIRLRAEVSKAKASHRQPVAAAEL